MEELRLQEVSFCYRIHQESVIVFSVCMYHLEKKINTIVKKCNIKLLRTVIIKNHSTISTYRLT